MTQLQLLFGPENEAFRERCNIVMYLYSMFDKAQMNGVGEAGLRRAVDGLLTLIWEDINFPKTTYL